MHESDNYQWKGKLDHKINVSERAGSSRAAAVSGDGDHGTVT